MAVTDQDVTGVAHINAVWIRRQRLVSETTDESPVLSEHCHTVSLQHIIIVINTSDHQQQHFNNSLQRCRFIAIWTTSLSV